MSLYQQALQGLIFYYVDASNCQKYLVSIALVLDNIKPLVTAVTVASKIRVFKTHKTFIGGK